MNWPRKWVKIDNMLGMHIEAQIKLVTFYFPTINYCCRGVDHFLAKFNPYILVYNRAAMA